MTKRNSKKSPVLAKEEVKEVKKEIQEVKKEAKKEIKELETKNSDIMHILLETLASNERARLREREKAKKDQFQNIQMVINIICWLMNFSLIFYSLAQK